MKFALGSKEDSELSQAWWVTGTGKGVLLETSVRAQPTDDEAEMVLVRTLYSGISRGTEALVFHGRVPVSEYHRMQAPFQEGGFPFPVKYGYANVGEVAKGPAELTGKAVFCLYPHQRHYAVPASAVIPIPDGVPPERAVLAANMETALNGLWDALPAVGDRIAVVGLGVVGCLVAWLASQIPGTRVTAVDTNPGRRTVMETLGVDFVTETDKDDHDVVFHTSGHPSGLSTALGLAGPEATVLEMSWYGDQPVAVPLGGPFHARRLILKSSQVGNIAPTRQPRWDYRRRMAKALELLADDALDVLISGESPFEDMPKVMPAILDAGSATLCHRIIY